MATRSEITGANVGVPVTWVSFSPDGETLIAGGFDNLAGFWDVSERGRLTNLARIRVTGSNLLRYASFSPDGETYVTVTQGGYIEIWDVPEFASLNPSMPIENKRETIHGHTEPVFQGAFSPDGTVFATAAGTYGVGEYAIVLWDFSRHVTPVAHIPDVHLKAAVRASLGKTGYGPVTQEEMARLTRLDASNRGIRDLLGLSFATGLTRVNLEGNPLNESAYNTHIPALETRGVEVLADPRPDPPVVATPDFNGDGRVDFGDFVLFASLFGLGEGDAGYHAKYDLDGDKRIGFGDFVKFAASFGQGA